MHVCPSQQKGVLIGARQTEDHWKPPDRESVGAKAQDKVSVRPEGWAGRSVRCPGKKGTDAASPTLDARAPGCSRSSLCARMCSAEQQQETEEEEACRRPRSLSTTGQSPSGRDTGSQPPPK